ncbi:MAG: ORF6N domain-containing protein [Thermodesulfobacteriota bacterium]|nr:ORF6N domain-containing protein [Thermodesulfobacteriota bacterium]
MMEMAMANEQTVIPVERIERKIYFLRGQKVMLDRDLAALYGVPTKVLNQAVKRHRDRLPEDFMFQLSMREAKDWWLEIMEARLRSQTVTLKRGQHLKYRPYAFTEHGILMLSSILNSERAVQVNIQIMRAFVRLRQMLATNANLERRLNELEKKYNAQFKVVFDAIRQLMAPPPSSRKKIGFQLRERRAMYGKR